MRAQDLRFYELIRKDPETGFPLILSTRCFPVTLGGAERMILDIVQSIGRDRFFKLQFRQWHDTGMGAATLLGEAYQFDSPYEWFMAQSVVLQQMGFARQDIADFKLEEPGIRFSGTWKDSINAIPCEKIFKGRTGPVCAGLCGFVSGYSSAVLGTSILVREKSCVAQGPKFCSFEGRPVSDWEDITDTPDW